MKRTKWVASGVAVGFLAASVAAGIGGSPAPQAIVTAKPAIGLTSDGKLVSFNTLTPSVAKPVGAITGLSGDSRLIGIDYRVQDGLLYGVGDLGGVYTLAGATATKVSQLTIAPSGTNFGVDFNPAADRLRVISDTGQNLRHDVVGGTTVADGPLTYPATPTAAATTGVGVTAAAYTNNDLDPATSTTLFNIDTTLDQVVLQSPANAGLLASTGKLGVDAAPDAGFDITADNAGFAVLAANGESRLYSVSLLTGEVDAAGKFPRGVTVTDIAIRIG
ncbi:uncharacterized protein DUF4394 [Microbacterium sp. SLBN-154]|uniref:DUF4394 domain-containing protein n=1 Tax=Microbacterium sp. SLBN-154 TaxID=2768458 RepID=UPI00115278D8|nr:DUF4394 domain-containing protein [Microbacterium sp. SLBN-154]TQK18610.1 uncharacterized protein DUF4394 [Microbacterium sp. SLBN-154]